MSVNFRSQLLLPRPQLFNTTVCTEVEKPAKEKPNDATYTPNENGETNDSVAASASQNDQENNNVESDNSADATFSSSMDDSLTKPDYDIESEIDVCSGEDDDVLELDVHKQNSETVEINSSSEEEIEVCDYEPMGKRGNYNTYTPPIRF